MASIIGTPTFFDLGETTTPGAQTITVPSDATHVAIFFAMSDSADTPDVTVSSLSSTFAGTFTINNSVSTSVSAGGAVCVAAVTSTGSGKTFTPVFAATSIVAGSIACVVFLKEVGATWPTAVGFGHATGTGTTAGTASASGLNGGLAIALDTRLDTTATLPATESGWTSVVTGQRGPGTYGYYCLCRLRSLALTSTATVNATTQGTFASVISLLTVESWHIGSGALSGGAGTVAGTATHKTRHSASGVLAGSAGTVAGTAAHRTLHTASGTLAGSSGVVAGTASTWRAFSASGVLAGSAGAIVGAASRWRAHSASGVLAGSSGVVEGTATLTQPSGTSHTASGTLTGGSGVIDGAANHLTLHTAIGVLSGSAGVLDGISTHYAIHTASGDLVGPSGTISGSAINGDGVDDTVVQPSGGGGNQQKKRKRLAILEVDGKEYTIPADDVQSFLNALVKPDKRKERKPEPKTEVAIVAPVVKIVEVAPEIERVVVQKVDRTNELLLSAWNRAVQREMEEEEDLICLLAA